MKNKRLKLKSCRSKKKYDTFSDALTGKGIFNRKNKDSVEAYKCKFCSGYHIGHKPNRPIYSHGQKIA